MVTSAPPFDSMRESAASRIRLRLGLAVASGLLDTVSSTRYTYRALDTVSSARAPAGPGERAMNATQDELAVRNLVDGLVAGWNAHDGAAFARPFATDADFTNVMGLRARGRVTIARGHDEI